MSKINVMKGNFHCMWYDTCETIHLLYNKLLFKTYHESDGEQFMQIYNEGRTKVVGKGNVDLHFHENDYLHKCITCSKHEYELGECRFFGKIKH